MLRRSFIGGLFTVLVTPAIVRAASLMPISPTEKIYTLDTHPEIVLEYLKGLNVPVDKIPNSINQPFHTEIDF